MSKTAQLTGDLAAIWTTLDRLDGELSSKAAALEVSLHELRRQAKASPHRRGGPGSRDANKYALGSVMVLAGLEDVDSLALSGLLAHPALLVCWLSDARSMHPSGSFGDLVNLVFADRARFEFCKQWGRVIGWRYCKKMYDAAVQAFIQSGRSGPSELWRKKQITSDQETLIQKLCELLARPAPTLSDRGEAFEWIRENGGNPQHWFEPSLPAQWSE